MLVTSADSRVRVVDGSDLVHKFKGKDFPFCKTLVWLLYIGLVNWNKSFWLASYEKSFSSRFSRLVETTIQQVSLLE